MHVEMYGQKKIHFGYFYGFEGKYPFRFSTLSMNHQRELKKVMVENITNVHRVCDCLLRDHFTQTLCETLGT